MTSLDELPQLLNVLKGDRSLVGNQPLPLDEAATLLNGHHTERFWANYRTMANHEKQGSDDGE